MASSNKLVSSDNITAQHLLQLNISCNAAERISEYSNLSSILAAYNVTQKLHISQRSITTITEESSTTNQASRGLVTADYNPDYDNYDHNYEEVDGILTETHLLNLQNSASGV